MTLAVTELPTTTLRTELEWCLAQARTPILRPMAQWIEETICLPNGPYAGQRYRHDRHPVSRLWFDALDSRLWSRFAATGPTQCGKTLMCYVGPVLYHLFEVGETVIVGLPSMDMANDKWQQDFLPVIEASDYRDMLPDKGEGSRGGQVKRSITFKNGATLRFMTAGGSDKKRAGYTSRVVAITETDGMDESGEASREADKIEQIEGRTRAFGRTGKRVYLECTVSIERGRIWQEVKQGTDSRILRPCPHCGCYVAPEREHLSGWQDAESEEDAASKAFWACPNCGEAWSEDDRQQAAKRVVLAHKGQEVTSEGQIVGPLPATQTLGFRWSAIDNPFVTAADLGAEEWKAKRSSDAENAEKKMRQFVWALPYEPPDVDMTPLDAGEVATRKCSLKCREVPNNGLGVVVQIDTGKRRLHWTAMAVVPDSSLPIVEYGEQPTDADKIGVFRGLVEALRKLQSYFDQGWGGRKPLQVWIDSGYHEHTDAVYAFCAEANARLEKGQEIYRPTKGYGEQQSRIGRYVAPTARSRDIVFIGKEYHISHVRRNGRILPGVLLVHVNSDHWKSELHQRLVMPPEQPGAVVLYDHPDPYGHSAFAAQLTAEKQVEKMLPGRGAVIVWERLSRDNHFLDSSYGATAAADFVLRLRDRKPGRPPAEERMSAQQLKAAGERRLT